MAINYVGMDFGDTPGEAASAVSAPSTSGSYGKELNIAWDDNYIEHIGQIYDGVGRIIEHMEHSNEHTNGSVGGGVAGCKGYRVSIDYDNSEGDAGGQGDVEYVAIGSTNNSILVNTSQVNDTGFEISLEGNAAFQTSGLPQSKFIELAHQLREALLQLDYPLA